MPTRFPYGPRLAACLLVLVLALASWAQQIAYGTVKGTVRYEGDLPYMGIVNFTIQGPPIVLPNNCGTIKAEDRYTQQTGSFEISLPVATWDITVAGTRQAVTVVEKQITTVELILQRTHGILLTAMTPDGHLLPDDDFENAWASARYTIDEHGENNNLAAIIGHNSSAICLSGGRFWFQDVPDNIRSVRVDLYRVIRGMNEGARYPFKKTAEWTFTTPDPKRNLTMVLMPLQPVRIRISDAAGRPLRQAKLARVQLADFDLLNRTTDADGMLLLGKLQGNAKYRLTVYGTDATAMPLEISVNDRGEVTPGECRLSMVFRTVTHRVLTPDGKPARNHPMRISYTWNSEITLRDGATDANGIMTWRNVPPTAAVVWGPGIPAAEVAAESPTIHPITKPVVSGESNDDDEHGSIEDMLHGSHSIIFTIDGANERAGSLPHYAIEGLRESSGLCCYEQTPLVSVLPAPKDQASSAVRYRVNGDPTFGRPVNILLWTPWQPTRYAALFDCYLPREGGVLRMPANRPLRVRLRLRTPDGMPVAAIDAMGVRPDGDDALARFLSPERVGDAPLSPPVPLGNGDYEVALPCPGAYRLVLGVNRRSLLTPPGPRFTVTAAMRELMLTMPQPLAVVPPGTEVYCLPLAAPARPVVVVAPPGATRVPIFVEPSRLLAYWYRLASDKLVLWNRLDGAAAPRVLSLQHVTITVTSSYHTPCHLLPLLPVPAGAMAHDGQPHADPHRRVIPLVTGKPNEVLLWPGPYAAIWQDGSHPFTLLDIAESRTPADVTLHLEYVQSGGTYRPVFRQREKHFIRLQFPAGDACRIADNTLLVTDDTGLYRQVFTTVDTHRGIQSVYCSIPRASRTITVQALGVGVVRDLNVSDQRKSGYVIDAWQPGEPLNGRLLGRDGKPHVGEYLVQTSDGLRLRAATDHEGRFSVVGMLPGGFNLATLDAAEKWQNGWYEHLAPGGLTAFNFGEKSDQPTYTASPFISSTEHRDDFYAWWFPDNLPSIGTPKDHHPTLAWNSGGWLWEMLTPTPLARHFRTSTSEPLDDRVPRYASLGDARDDARTNAPGPTLGIILPYTPGMLKPGPLTIAGLKNRAPALLHIPEPQWAVHPALRCITFTLPSIPPGDYEVTFLNGDAVVKQPVTVTPAGGILLLK